eukprot:6184900-Pleurochrysis_carterae.AAC.5
MPQPRQRSGRENRARRRQLERPDASLAQMATAALKVERVHARSASRSERARTRRRSTLLMKRTSAFTSTTDCTKRQTWASANVLNLRAEVTRETQCVQKASICRREPSRDAWRSCVRRSSFARSCSRQSMNAARIAASTASTTQRKSTAVRLHESSALQSKLLLTKPCNWSELRRVRAASDARARHLCSSRLCHLAAVLSSKRRSSRARALRRAARSAYIAAASALCTRRRLSACAASATETARTHTSRHVCTADAFRSFSPSLMRSNCTCLLATSSPAARRHCSSRFASMR